MNNISSDNLERWGKEDRVMAELLKTANWPSKTCEGIRCKAGLCCKHVHHHIGGCCLHCGNDERKL